MLVEKAESSLKHQTSVLVSFIVAKAMYSWFVLRNAQKKQILMREETAKISFCFTEIPLSYLEIHY